MKKLVSLKTQRVMSFIPFVNFFVLFTWLYNYRLAVNDYKVFAKALALLFIIALPLALAEFIIINLFSAHPTVCNIIGIIAMYCIPLCLSRSIIYFQSKIFEK